MIILEGPDNSGKSTLAGKLIGESLRQGVRPLTSWKAVAATSYKDYMHFLRGPKSDPLKIETWVPGLALSMGGAVVCDRLFYSEIPYSKVLRGQDHTMFTLKQWHNMHLSTIAFNPLYVLSTRKSQNYIDSVPEAFFEPILEEYRRMLDYHDLKYTEYDFQQADVVDSLLMMEENRNAKIKWWLDSPELFGVGNTVDPVVFIMAQDLGPSNIHRIPFEQGPSGYYLSDLLDGIPLGSFYLTNWRKTSDMGRNVDLLRTELENLRPTHVILLGRQAEDSGPTLDDFVAHTNVHNIVHPGWVVNHSPDIPTRRARKIKFAERWLEIWHKALPEETKSLTFDIT